MFFQLFDIAYMVDEISLVMDWAYYVLVLCVTSECCLRHVMFSSEL
jgi:hypothetical protein